MFWHIFKYRLKCLSRNKAMLFWTLVFPLVLGTFFKLAFSSINENTKFEPINIAVIDNTNFNNNLEFKNVINTLSSGTEKIFITEYVNLDEAKVLLEDNTITGYILVEERIKIVVKDNGTEETIMKYVVDNFYQMTSAVNNVISFKPEIIYNGVLQIITENNNYLNDITNTNVDNIVVYFYTLIGMVCMYGSFFGINAICETEANLSKKGARIAVAPVRKGIKLVGSLAAAFLVQFIMVLILFAYLTVVLKIGFGEQLLPVIFITLWGSFCGLAFGSLIGSSNRMSENGKIGFSSAITMTFSFLAGMMMQQIKYLISNHVPVLGYINPINLVTDGLYSLYYYDGYTRYFVNMGFLMFLSFILLIVSYFFMRRKKYDSI